MLKNAIHISLFVLCIIMLYFFSYFHLLENFSLAPVENHYIGFASNYPIDQLGNLSVILQGYSGEWMRDTHYTTTVLSKKFALKIEYIIIGHIGKWLGLAPVHAYYGATLFLSMCLIVTIWFVVRVSLPKKHRMLGFFFSLFATGFSWKDLPLGWRQLQGDMMVFQRTTTASPHYMIGSIGSLMSMVFLVKYCNSKRLSFFLGAIVFGIVAMHVFAPTMLIVLLALPITLILEILRRESKTVLLYRVNIFFLYAMPICIPIIYNRYANQFFDWSTFARTEQLLPYVVNWYQYIFLVGGLLIPSIVAIPHIAKKGSLLHLLFVSWIVSQVIFQFFVRHIIGASVVRFFQTPYYVIFAIVGTIGIQIIVDIVQKHWSIFIAHNVKAIVVFAIILLGWYTYAFSFQWQSTCFCQGIPKNIGYPNRGIVEAFYWLDSHTVDREIVMTGEYTGLLIPAFSGNKVYTSWWHRLTDHPSYYQLLPMLLRFYKGEMSEQEAHIFLQSEHISYVMYSLAEGFDSKVGLVYSSFVLTEAFRNSQAIVYKVK